MTEATSLTVPAACLPQLGGLQRGPAVLTHYVDPDHPGERFDLRWDGAGDQMPDPSCRRLLVEESEPALLRVLARHRGWGGNSLLRLRAELPDVWTIRNVTKRGAWPTPRPLRPVADEDRGPYFSVNLPAHISVDLPYLEALAAAVVWFARVARMDCGLVVSPKALALAEQRLARLGADLPAWTVTP